MITFSLAPNNQLLPYVLRPVTLLSMKKTEEGSVATSSVMFLGLKRWQQMAP